MAKDYIVTITVETPIVGMNTTDELVIYADNADDAKKQARAKMRREGWTRHDGRLRYQAKVV